MTERMHVVEIVAEWRRGCGNVAQHYKDGVPSSPNPGDCHECTAAAMRAVASSTDDQALRAKEEPNPGRSELLEAAHGLLRASDKFRDHDESLRHAHRLLRQRMEKPAAVDDAFLFLAAEVMRYVERPGCNVQARATAMTRLMWSLEEARRRAK